MVIRHLKPRFATGGIELDVGCLHKVRVLLVEDKLNSANIIIDEIMKDERLDCVGFATDQASGVKAACRFLPDIVTLDLHAACNCHDGIETAKEIRLKTNARIIFLAGAEHRGIMYEACIKAFASGYIFKSQAHDHDIADSIFDAATQETPLKLAFQRIVRDALTPAQLFVLDSLIAGNIEALGYSSSKTIANHKTIIFKKLGLKSEKELLHVFRNW